MGVEAGAGAVGTRQRLPDELYDRLRHIGAETERMRDGRMSGGSEVSENAMLFLSSLLLLIDIAPRDVVPSHKKRVRAVEVLREKRNIIGEAPSNVNIAPANSGMSLVRDPESYAILADFIRRRSSLAGSVLI